MNLLNYKYLGRDHLQGLNEYKVGSWQSLPFVLVTLPVLVHCRRYISSIHLRHAAVLELLCGGKIFSEHCSDGDRLSFTMCFFTLFDRRDSRRSPVLLGIRSTNRLSGSVQGRNDSSSTMDDCETREIIERKELWSIGMQ